jgi:hypothetical protein
MNRNLNIPILLLTISAIVLSVMVFTLTSPEPADAAGDTVRQGRWILTAARLDRDTDLVYVLDLKNNLLSVYAASERNERLGRVTSVDVRRLFAQRDD